MRSGPESTPRKALTHSIQFVGVAAAMQSVVTELKDCGPQNLIENGYT